MLEFYFILMLTCTQKNDIFKSDDEKRLLIKKLKNNLSVLRARSNLSQNDVAKIIGVSRQTYCSIENNREMSWTIYLALLFLFDSLDETNELLSELKIFS